MNFSLNRGLPLTSLIWISALAAAIFAVWLRGGDIQNLLPYAAVATVPALLGLVLWPFSRREWVQILVIFSWIVLAIVATLAIAFVPMAVLFLLAPAAAALFEREKVIEAMIFSAIFAGAVFYYTRSGLAPAPIASHLQSSWGQLAGIMSTIAFLIGSMFASARSRGERISPDLARPAKIAKAFPGAALRFSPEGKLLWANAKARAAFDIADQDFGFVTLSNLVEDGKLRAALAKAKGDVAHLAFPHPLGPQAEDTQAGLAYGLSDIWLSKDKGGAVNLYALAVPEPSRLPDRGLATAGADIGPDLGPAGFDEEKWAHMQEAARRKAEEKTLFFAGVSHELRTPLNAIIGFSDMMRSRLFGPLPGKYAEYADLIHDSGQHMLDLVGDVLDMSKIEVGKYKLDYGRFDAADVVRSSVKMVRPSADAAELVLDVDIDPEADLLIEADRRAVRQILLNLLSNAIKFTPKGGHVGVSAYAKDGFLELLVKDTGTGMSAEEIRAVGDPFKQAESASLVKARGSGLGLSLVKNLVGLHDGRFTIESRPGNGTEVTVLLPLHRADLDE